MIKAIVLAGDRNYTTQLETTIKSILYHNRDVKIYILNQDIMPDTLYQIIFLRIKFYIWTVI